MTDHRMDDRDERRPNPSAQAAFDAYRRAGGRAAGTELRLLSSPDRTCRFSAPWMDDAGGMQVGVGCFAEYGRGRGRNTLLFRRKARWEEAEELAFLGMLENALLTGRAESSVCALACAPYGLSPGESMRACRAFAEALEHCAGERGRERAVFGESVPRRERDYLNWRMDTEPTPEPAMSAAEAAAYGLCVFVREALARTGMRPEGRTAVILGGGDRARYAAAYAAGMGFRVGTRPRFAAERADVWLLCGAEQPLSAAEAGVLLACGPVWVFEGAVCACEAGAARFLAEEGVLFAPAVAAGCGAAVLEAYPAASPWEAGRRIREVMGDLFRRVWDAGAGDPYRGAYAAAVSAAAEDMARRGV